MAVQSLFFIYSFEIITQKLLMSLSKLFSIVYYKSNYNNMRATNNLGYNIKDQAYFSRFQNKTYAGHKKNSAAAWNSEGNLLATGETSLKIWSFDIQNGLELVIESRNSDGNINQIKFYQQNFLATLNRDSIKLWDVRQSSKASKTQKKTKADILTMAWNHSSTAPCFTLLSKDNFLSFFDLRNFSLSQPVYTDKCKNDITEIQWDKTGSVMFCAGGDSSSSVLMIYNNNLEPISEITSPHNSKINSISIDPTNQYLASCSDDSTTSLTALPDIICERVYSHTDCVMKKVAFSAKGQYLAASSQEPKLESTSNKGEEVKISVQEPCIDFYNVRTGGHAHRIKCGTVQQVLQWHPKRPILAYFDFDDEDRKQQSSEREQKYLHIFGI